MLSLIIILIFLIVYLDVLFYYNWVFFMNKSTKVIATIGPSTSSYDMLKKLYNEGMNIVRFNFSHGSHDFFSEVMKNIRKVSDEISIMLDTKGPDIRTGECQNDSVVLVDDQEIIFTNKPVIATSEIMTINYNKLFELKPGNRILIDDGLVETEVISVCKDVIKARVINGGIIGPRKTISIKGHIVDIPFLSKKDKDDIRFGIENGVDYIAASFVKNRKDIVDMKKYIKKYTDRKIMIISKIEHWEAVKNIQDIIEESDGIMVARGDLGVEVSLEKVPKIQLNLIRWCNESCKPVIVATHMLESMKDNPRPTRAEVSDVSKAIIEGTDAVMLSSETAIGKYPLNSVKMMTKIAKEYDYLVENNIKEDYHKKYNDLNISSFAAHSAFLSSKILNVKAIIAPTESGFTARNISRFKPKCPIYAITYSMKVFRELQLSWGVYPIYEDKKSMIVNFESYVKDIIKKLYNKRLIDKDDLISIIAGHKLYEPGSTNVLEIHIVKEILKL
jgi:pyruvate kinase